MGGQQEHATARGQRESSKHGDWDLGICMCNGRSRTVFGSGRIRCNVYFEVLGLTTSRCSSRDSRMEYSEYMF
jgi:hypothetical protein